VKVLVTGGAGLVAGATIPLLLQRGHSVRVLDNLAPPTHAGPPPFPPEVEFVQGDVRQREDLARVLPDIDAVLHLANYMDYLPAYGKQMNTNAVGVALLYEVIAENRHPVQRVVLGSSQAVYGEGKYRCSTCGEVYPEQRPLEQLERGDWEPRCPACGGSDLAPLKTDEAVTRPTNLFGVSKLAGEQAAFLLGRRHGVPTVALRYSLVHGVGQDFRNAYTGFLRIFALRLYFQRPTQVLEDGAQLRDCLDVEDAARATVLALEHPDAAFRALNAGGGQAGTLLEYARVVTRFFEAAPDPEVPGRFRWGDTRHMILDSGALKALGWEPQIPFESTVRNYVEWLRQQPGLDTYFEGAEHLMEKTGTLRAVLV
jgi:dTDP-L-rhamnose 4-epimerase